MCGLMVRTQPTTEINKDREKKEGESKRVRVLSRPLVRRFEESELSFLVEIA
jgi:hypothetical protein